MSRTESVPTTWDDTRDVAFFRLVCHLFDPRMLEAASCLLGANDPEPSPVA